MEEIEQALMPIEMPITDEKKKKPSMNCLQDILLELMERDKVELADIQKATGIKWGTLYGWYKGDVGSQLLDFNIYKLAKFFNVSIHYLAFGIGDDSDVFSNDVNEEKNE